MYSEINQRIREREQERFAAEAIQPCTCTPESVCRSCLAKDLLQIMHMEATYEVFFIDGVQ